MANRYEGIKCPVCNSYLFENTDDIVVCPVCGAPHHRACYMSLGHCGYESTHGTDREYDKLHQNDNPPVEDESSGEGEDREVKCPTCGRMIKSNMLFCPYCGAMRDEDGNAGGGDAVPPFADFMPRVDRLGGVHPQTDIGDGVTASEAADFIFSNTARYIPKFASGSKTSWNWLAFLIPHGFFLYRKMYVPTILAALLFVAASVFTLPFNNELQQILSTLPVNYTQADLFSALMPDGGGFAVSTFATVLYFAGMLLSLAVHILAGIFGDYIYKRHVITSVLKYRSLEPEEREEKYRKKGMPNMFFLILITLGLPQVTALLSLLF